MTREERIYGSSPLQEGSRWEDKIDRRLLDFEWRILTESPARRPARYDTMKIAAFAWLRVDGFREWSRHRGATAAFQ